jgi:hypothetical protein
MEMRMYDHNKIIGSLECLINDKRGFFFVRGTVTARLLGFIEKMCEKQLFGSSCIYSKN